MKFRLIFLAALLGALLESGCASLDKSVMTRLEPIGESGNGEVTLRFAAVADAAYPADSAAAEATRLDWLRQALAENGYGGRPYTIVQRRAFVRSKGLLGSIQDIYYDVRVNR